MTETVENLFYYSVFITDLLIILLFIIFGDVRREKPLWIIFFYCLLDLIVNSIVEFFPFKYAFILYDFFTFFEYSCFTYFLWINIQNSIFRKIMIAASIAFTVFLVFYYFNAKYRSVDSVPIGIQTILILIYAFYYFFEQMNNTSNLFIYSRYPFWIITGIMIYLAGSFFIYIFANQIDKKFLLNYWFLTNIFYSLKNLLFALGILFNVNQKKKSLKIRPYLN